MLKLAYSQNNICSIQHMLKITFSKEHMLKIAFAQNNICSKQHMFKTTYA